MILVTGANGFIGSAFVWELNQAGINDIVCVDTVGLNERPDLLRSRTYSKFIGKDEIWNFLREKSTIENLRWIIHMGACSDTTELNEDFLRENNTVYTQRLWEWCTLHRKPFLFASSGAVYGSGDKGFDDTTAPREFRALNPYGESKLAFDRWAVEQNQVPPVWLALRFFNVFGPQEYFKKDMASVVFKAFNQISTAGELNLFRSHNPNYKDGEQKRDFVYVKDVTRWMLELMKIGDKEIQTHPEVLNTRSAVAKSGIYNMGFGTARTWLDLANATFKEMDRPIKVKWIDIPEAMRPRYQYFTEAKMTRIFKIGLSQPQWPLEKAIQDYVGNYLLQKNRFL